MTKVAIVSLGCDKNRIDAEKMAKRLEDAGYSLAPTVGEADCAVINTCGFIEAAKEEAIGAIFDAVYHKQNGRLKAVVVTGCLAQRYCDEITRDIPEVDAVAGLSHNGDIVKTVEEALAGRGIHEAGEPERLELDGERRLSTPAHYAYLKIAEGCRHHCTYCAIPMIRGGYRSRSEESILDEARALADKGVKELIVIAQDTTAYGCDIGGDLAGLLYKLNDIPGIVRIRVLYGYPDGINDRLLTAFKELPKLAKYLDMPLQHCNPEILKLMGRRGDREWLSEIIGSVRDTAPLFAIRTTFIAGFPCETEAHSRELCEFIAAEGFARSGCFAFSEEEGTAAVKLPHKHSDAVKQRRADNVSRACYNAMLEFQKKRVGTVDYAVAEGRDEETGEYILRGEFDAPEIDTSILVKSDAPLVMGEFYRVRITGVEGDDVVGTIIDSEPPQEYIK